MVKKSVIREQESKRILVSKELKKNPVWVKDHKEVTGKFRNFETPGAALTMYWRKWPSDKIEKYILEDGQEYQLPRMVADRLNNDCWTPVHEHAVDANGKKIERVGRKVHKYGFINTSFGDEDHLDVAPAPTIYTVEAV